MAISSMTGFGREQCVLNGREITVEIRAVNHRFHEFTARIPRQYSKLEELIKSKISTKVKRGKVEVSVIIHNIEGREATVILNKELVNAYLSELRLAQSELGLLSDFNFSDVFKIPDAFNVIKKEVDEDEISKDVGEVLDVALSNFLSMRKNEGAKMQADIQSKLAKISVATNQIDKAVPQIAEKHRQKLTAKITEFVGSGVDEQRIILEAAIFAEKSAVDEEIVRLKSHISQVREILENEDVVGRKLDFIVQEINREINTIGSKSHEVDITRIVVDLKSELEKIREQIQNIE
ncbi:MAG: YicC family protein [Oscillospiraceae bacterium]|nr:YicC family protein [Oscillospiraceae bacterium]